MPFDAEGYRKAARAQGISDSEIEKDIAEEMGTNNKPADFAFPEKGDAQAKGADTWMAPAAIGGAMGAGAAIAPGIYKSLKDKFGSATPPARIEPVMLPESIDLPKTLSASEQRQQMVSNREQPKPNALNSYTEQKYGVPLATLEQKTGGPLKSIADIDLVGSTLQKGGNVSVNTTGAFTQPSAYTQAPVPAQAAAPAQVAQQPVQTAEPVIPKPASSGTPAGQVVATAATPQAVEATVAKTEPVVKVKAPVEPTTFRADLGPGDNWLYNTAGPEKRKAILKEFNNGKPAKTYDEAQRLWNMYVESRREGFAGPEMNKEVRQERGIPPRENFGPLGKVAKVAGVAGLALTAAQMAQAAQAARKGDYSQAAEMGFNMLGLVPGLGVGFSALTHAGGLNKDEDKQLAYLQKVGAGRGIAPPSAYMR
jgi:hypothetical protein